MVELLGFIMATLAQKHCSRRKCPFGGNVFKNLPRVPEGFFPVVCGEIFAANKREKKPSGTQGIKNPTRYINLIMSIKYTIQHSLHLISEGNLFQRGCYLEWFISNSFLILYPSVPVTTVRLDDCWSPCPVLLNLDEVTNIIRCDTIKIASKFRMNSFYSILKKTGNLMKTF